MKLYDLSSGKVVTLEYRDRWGSGHGSIKGALSTGEKVSGEFRTTANALRSSGEQHGSMVLTGEGIVLDCEYIVDATGFASHGSGTCTDNKGGKYRLVF